MRVLGPIVSTWSLERAARDLLLSDRNLIGAYLDEINRQAGATSVRVERPRSVKARWRASRFSDDQLPAIVLINAGTVGDPTRDGEGLYSATWLMAVAAISQATSEDVAREVASDLSWAATAVLAQMLPKVDDRVVSAVWGGEEPPIDLDGDERSRCIFGQRLLITVQDVLCDLSGLPAGWDEQDPPFGQPPLNTGDLLTVLTTSVDVEPVEEMP